jgi:hypothetical protein
MAKVTARCTKAAGDQGALAPPNVLTVTSVRRKIATAPYMSVVVSDCARTVSRAITIAIPKTVVT